MSLGTLILTYKIEKEKQSSLCRVASSYFFVKTSAESLHLSAMYIDKKLHALDGMWHHLRMGVILVM
jgi:hypothetical protein